MQFEHLSGLIAAPFTPMHPDGALNLDLVPAYYQSLKKNGIIAAFINGSTGEGVSQTAQEKKAVMAAWAQATQGDANFKIITLLGGTSIAECKEQALYAKEVGIYGIAFTAPFYFKPASVEMLAACCAEIASSVPDVPFYYYHIPVLTGVGFAMSALLKAIDGNIENFAGIKYTHEDFMDFLSCLHFKNGKYDMLWGRDENMLPALALGAKGAVGSTYNYAAPLYLQLIDAYEKGDMKAARQLQQKSIHMIELLGKYGGIATGKAYMKLIGLDCGAFRLPIRNMSAADFDRFKTDVAALKFDDFRSK